MSKQAYTGFSTTLRDMAKRKGITPSEYVFNYRVFVEQHGGFEYNSEARKTINALQVELEILEEKAIHIFMPGIEFCDWIVSCVTGLDPIHAQVVMNITSEKTFVLCFPSSSKLVSVASVVPKIGFKLKKPVLFLDFPKGAYDYTFAAVELIHESFDFFKSEENILWYAKLIVGLGMYLSCFPEQMRDGLPSDLQHPSHHKHKIVRTIGISPDVVTHHDGPRPHYRVGHFRLLSSERFVNKKGQVVFVHGTFVKGKAKTVLGFDEEATTEDKAVNS